LEISFIEMNVIDRIYAKGKPSRLMEGFPFCFTAELSAAVMPPHRDANGGPVWIEYRKFNRLSRIYLFSFRLEIGLSPAGAACR
jgi:hypothetical protein